MVGHIVVRTCSTVLVARGGLDVEGVPSQMRIAVCTNRSAVLDVLPGLAALAHDVRRWLPDDLPTSSQGVRAVVVDTADGLQEARDLGVRLLRQHPGPVLVVIAEGSLVAVDHRWGPVEVLLPTATPAEIEFRLRLASARHYRAARRTGRTHVGALVLDSVTHTAWLGPRHLPLNERAFDVLAVLAAAPGCVQKRETLLVQCWGSRWHDPTGVDVVVRRIRHILDLDPDPIVTVRNVGYLLDPDRLPP